MFVGNIITVERPDQLAIGLPVYFSIEWTEEFDENFPVVFHISQCTVQSKVNHVIFLYYFRIYFQFKYFCKTFSLRTSSTSITSSKTAVCRSWWACVGFRPPTQDGASNWATTPFPSRPTARLSIWAYFAKSIFAFSKTGKKSAPRKSTARSALLPILETRTRQISENTSIFFINSIEYTNYIVNKTKSALTWNECDRAVSVRGVGDSGHVIFVRAEGPAAACDFVATMSAWNFLFINRIVGIII